MLKLRGGWLERVFQGLLRMQEKINATQGRKETVSWK